MTRMVCGLAFNADASQILLVQKTHPEWQKGRLNGIGGHVNEGETEIAAMVREFHEECGIRTAVHQWDSLFTLYGDRRRRAPEEQVNWSVLFFRTCLPNSIFRTYRSTGAERVLNYSVTMVLNEIQPYVMPNLHWIIPFAKDPFVRLPIGNLVDAPGRDGFIHGPKHE